MLRLLTTSVVIAAALCMSACGDDTSATNTSSLALSDAEGEALEACIAELEECRATTESAEEFREVCGELYACLPDRETEGARADDWRAFCAGVADRCANAEASTEDCAALQERCDRGFSGSAEAGEGDRPEEAEATMSREEGMCIRTCQEGGGSEEDCAAECTPA